MYKKPLSIIFIIFMNQACGSDVPQESRPHNDTALSDITDASDMKSDFMEVIDLSRQNLPAVCTKDLDCPRGKRCNVVGECFASTGCGLAWGEFIPDTAACYYDHDGDPCKEAGTFTAKECDEDSECPGDYLCIRRVCHLADRCDEGECQAGFVCASNIICVESSRCPSRM